jgi:multiple sugar transport system ATP-binding protein
MGAIELDRVVKRYGGVDVVHGVSLGVAEGEFMVFVGPSGCGKSTLLRMVAGLETISDGEIRIDGRRVNDVEPRHRDIAMVFQDYALYPHMSVRENLVFGLKMRGAPAADMAARVGEAARMLQIEPLLDRKPGQLSGGQRQRVAMGRAIVRRPKAFLFDEPLSNLDAKLRVDMRAEIKRLHAALRRTTIYVTHDQTEAMTLADRICVLRGGRIEQVGAPAELYERPANLFVAEFIGSPAMNLLPGRLRRDGPDGPAVMVGEGLAIPAPGLPGEEGRPVVVGLRPEHLEPPRVGDPVMAREIVARAEMIEPLGADDLVRCRAHGVAMTARLTPGRARAGADVVLTADLARAHFFDAANGARLGC